MATAAEVQTSYKAIVRADLNATTAQALADAINNGTTTLAAYQQSLIAQTASTSGAAVAIASFVTGLTPTSAKLDELKVAADAQVASYTKLGVANPALGAFEAFGKGFSQEAAFTTKYGALSGADFINTVYIQVYGVAPSAAALANLTGQLTYFTTLYTNAGLPNVAAQAKGAVLGQIVGYAFVDSAAAANSTLDNSVNTFFVNAANGSTTGYAAALPITGGSGTPGAILTLTTVADVVDPTAVSLQFKSTAGDDTIRAIDAASLTSSDVINGGAGIDTLVITGAIAGGTAPVINGVEKINFTAVNNALSLASATGVQNVENSGAGANSVTDADLLTTFTLSNAGQLGVTFKNVTGTNDTANVTASKALALSAITLTGVENVNVKTTGGAASDLDINDVDLKVLTVTGDQSITLDLTAATTALKTVNAGALTGGLTFNEVVKAVTITGGTGADAITLTNATATETVTVSTGAGADTINVALVTGKAVITGGAAADAITLQAGGAGTATLVYTAQTDSVFTNFDNVTAFTTAEDKLDFKGLALTGKNTIVSAGNTTNVTIGQFAGGVTDFFKVGGNTLAVATFLEGADTYVFADANNNGNFDATADLVIKLTGTAAVAVGDFVFA